MSQDEVSLKDAAVLAGVSKVTLWRAVQRGELPARQDDKNRYTVLREAVLQWRETFHPEPTQAPAGASVDAETLRETGPAHRNDSGNASGVSAETAKHHYETVYEAVEMVPADLHRVALETARHALEAARKAEERAERAERQREALGSQIAQYQHVLGERAESLLQSEAEARQAQMLAQQNADQLATFQREQMELLEHLQASRSRVEWLEKRVPKWLRRCLGAG